jgi:hypothetical protein
MPVCMHVHRWMGLIPKYFRSTSAIWRLWLGSVATQTFDCDGLEQVADLKCPGLDPVAHVHMGQL